MFLPSYYYRAIQTNLRCLSIVTTQPLNSRQISVRFFSLRKMNLGKSNNSKGSRGGGPTTPAVNKSRRFESHQPVAGDGPSRDVVNHARNRGQMSLQNIHQTSESALAGDGPSREVVNHARNRGQMSLQDIHQPSEYAPPRLKSRSYEEEFPPLSATLGTYYSKRKTKIDLGSEQKITDTEHMDSWQLNNVETTPSGENSFEHEEGTRKLDFSEDSPNVEPFKPFHICFPRRRNYFRTEEHIVKQRNVEGTRQRTLLRPGMVLLKRYINIRDQIQIVNTCQRLGKGPGGFYQPGYKSGAKLRLQMMCLGLNWDPETREYEELRSFDGCKPPPIPDKFSRLVQRAIRDSHDLIKTDLGANNVEDILPSMAPDICIVNFYSTSGRLGLHQDRDESEHSLRKGLPVVSFSVGDSAEFLYSDERGADKAERVVLESGDVLIFGGQSRHIFHGVLSIIPNSAPGHLLNMTRLRTGRLNLTFREY